MANVKIKCDNCGIEVRARNIRRRKGRLLCYKCYYREITPLIVLPSRVSIKEALQRSYLVGCSSYNLKSKAYPHGVITVPRVLVGKKIRLKLVGDISTEKPPKK